MPPPWATPTSRGAWPDGTPRPWP